MIRNVYTIRRHSQMRELGSALKFSMLEHLVQRPATCQQLADALGVSKQKAHYNLKGLLEQDLIEPQPEAGNNKEVYYRARAYNFVLDFSLGKNTGAGQQSAREMFNAILRENHGIDLDAIAARLLEDCLRLEPGQRLLLTTGRYNMPLVERLLVQAGLRQIETTLIYQHAELIRTKHEHYSVDALQRDYDRFNELLPSHHVYLNLNGESRFISNADPQRLAIRNRAFEASRRIIAQRGIRVAIMPGLMKETLQEDDIISEIRFWKAIDIDFARLYATTDAVVNSIESHKMMSLREAGTQLDFGIHHVMGEYGSFGSSPRQSPIINLPGGSVLVVPQPGSLNGILAAPTASAFGERIHNVRLSLRDSRIVGYTASEPGLLARAIEQGGADGGVVAMLTLNTNEHRGQGAVSADLRDVSPGAVALYFGENTSLGGDVRGDVEWDIQLHAPTVTLQ